jgi:hypothetical protein
MYSSFVLLQIDDFTLYLNTFLALKCIEQEGKQCYGYYVTEREKDDPSWTQTTHLLLSGIRVRRDQIFPVPIPTVS